MLTKSQGYCSIGIASAAMLSITTLATAKPLEMFWTEVDNTAGHVDDFFGPASNLTGFRTFDLYCQFEAGDRISVADFGIAGPNSGLSTTQSIFNHPWGRDTATTIFEENANAEWDTYLAMGDLDGTATNPNQIAIVHFDYSDPTAIEAVWQPSGPSGFPEAFPDENNHLWLARFTVSSAGSFGNNVPGEYLGGQIFLSGEGPNGAFGREIPANGVVDIPNALAVPTPGAHSVLALAGAACARRRRN